MDPSATSTAARARLLVPLLTLGAPLALWALLVARSDFLIDDAFISFRYARHWAETGVPTFDPGLPPVEGYSNFLWVLLLRLAHGAGFTLETASRALSIGFGLATIVLAWAFLRRGLGLSPLATAIGTTTLAAFPPFAVWCTGGLETASFTFFLLAGYLALARRGGVDRVWAGLVAGVCGLAVALSRVEGFAWVLAIAACAWLAQAASAEGVGKRRRRFVPFFVVYLFGFGAFLLWRHATYGQWVANTVHAKAALSAASVVRGLKTGASYLLIFLSPLVILACVPLAWRARRGAALGALGMFAAAFGYDTLVGGDWMPYFRFLAPATPFLAVLAALAASRGRAAAIVLSFACVLAVLPSFGVGLVPRAWLEPLYFRGFERVGYQTEQERWERGNVNLEAFSMLGRALAQIARPDDALTFGAIGAVGWYSGMRIYDRNGLIDPEVARRAAPEDAEHSAGHDKQVPRAFFLDREPTLFHAVFATGEPSPALEQALLKTTVQRVFLEGQGEEPLRSACLPEVHPIHAAEGLPAGTLLVLRATKEGEKARRYWEKVLGK